MVGFKVKAAVQPRDFIQDLYSFPHYLFSRAVPGNDRYFIFFHIKTPSKRCQKNSTRNAAGLPAGRA
jgi:hypothetical protein